MSDPRSDFMQKARAGLEPFRVEATEKIASVLGRELPGVESIWFTIYSNTDGVPVTIFGMDADGVNEVCVPDPEDPEDEDSVVAVLCEPLIASDDEEYVDWEEIDEFCDIPPDGEPELDGYELGAMVIAEFLSKCYQDVGGVDHRLPAFARHHDRSAKMNLKTGKWE